MKKGTVTAHGERLTVELDLNSDVQTLKMTKMNMINGQTDVGRISCIKQGQRGKNPESDIIQFGSYKSDALSWNCTCTISRSHTCACVFTVKLGTCTYYL